VTDAPAALADGEWHRLHPATPLLRGGAVFIAIAAIVIGNLRDRVVDLLFGAPEYGGDPIDEIVGRGLVPLALLGVLVVILVIIAATWLSWRMHTFRITDELVEVRSGLLFRTERKGRLDRIQGINVNRPLLARLFGAARLEITLGAGDGSVQLAYLSGSRADALRGEILRRASGARARDADAAAAPTAAPAGSLIEQRVGELVAPELDPALVSPDRVVRMHPGRVIASTLLSGGTVWIIVLAAVVVSGSVIAGAASGEPIAAVAGIVFTFIPMLIGWVSFLIRRITRSLRFSVAATTDGLRVGYGLLETTNETLPPGRIHSLSISQNLLWRPFDWWEVRVNRAGSSSAQGAAGRQNTSVLPVGTREEALRIVGFALPGLLDEDSRAVIAAGLGSGGGFTTSPRRAAVLRWFSWRRNGLLVRPDAVLLRRGAIWRDLVVVPTARVQSVAASQGPLERALGVGSLAVHTVAGPIVARVGALDVHDVEDSFARLATTTTAAVAADRSQRWRSAEGTA